MLLKYFSSTHICICMQLITSSLSTDYCILLSYPIVIIYRSSTFYSIRMSEYYCVFMLVYTLFTYYCFCLSLNAWAHPPLLSYRPVLKVGNKFGRSWVGGNVPLSPSSSHTLRILSRKCRFLNTMQPDMSVLCSLSQYHHKHVCKWLQKLQLKVKCDLN